MNELIYSIQQFGQKNPDSEKVQKAIEAVKMFNEKYPFRKNKESINELTEEQLYSTGSGEYFFLWIEHKTRSLGAIFTYGGNVYPNAVENIILFKSLINNLVNDNLPIHKKIDDDWGRIKGFGGDKLIVKKILFCYYPNEIIPIFKTEHLLTYCRFLKINFEEKSLDNFGKIFSELSLGQQFEILNTSLFNFWKNNVPDISIPQFCNFLNSNNDTSKVSNIVKRDGTKPLNKMGLLFSPKYEQEVLYLFSKLHRDIGFPYIQTIQVQFPDIIALDRDRKLVSIELEVFSSDFISHKHDKSKCDYIVCWENDLTDNVLEDLPKIIPLKDYFEEFDI